MAKRKSARSARETILNGTRVTLLTGERPTIRPWSIEQRDDILPLLANLVTTIQKAGADAYDLDASAFLLKHSTEIDELAQLTLGWDDAKWRTLTLEDSLLLTRTVLDVCIIRPDGGGPLGELLRLWTRGPRVVANVIGPALIQIASEQIGTQTSEKPSRRSGAGVTRLARSAATRPKS
jgi:hypothetical protein